MVSILPGALGWALLAGELRRFEGQPWAAASQCDSFCCHNNYTQDQQAVDRQLTTYRRPVNHILTAN